MSEETQSESADMEMEIELPPVLAQFLGMVRADQKKLMRDKNFTNGEHLRKFVALTLMERLVQAVEMLGTTAYDLHQLGVSNATQLQHMRRWTAKHLRKLGAEVNDGDAFAGVGKEHIDACGQALYALASYLQAKYPGDKEIEVRFNAAQIAFNELVGALMGDQSVDDDDDDDDDEKPGEEPEADGDGDPADDEEAP